jgi:hypothetical protein
MGSRQVRSSQRRESILFFGGRGGFVTRENRKRDLESEEPIYREDERRDGEDDKGNI